MSKKNEFPFHSSREEVARVRETAGANYKLAFDDLEFLVREELRPVRLQLELLKPELILKDNNIEETIVFFGSARLPAPEIAQQRLQQAQEDLEKNPSDPALQKALRTAEKILVNSGYLQEATRLAEFVSTDPDNNFYVVTGGGPSFMEAANKGAHNVNKPSVSLGVVLPHEQTPNEYTTQGLTFQFHYFAIRKMHFLMRAKALVAFPGGFGTLDELFETLTLIQTKKIQRIPLLLFNKAYWESVINFDGLVEGGTISAKDLNLIQYVETAEEAWAIIKDCYQKQS